MNFYKNFEDLFLIQDTTAVAFPTKLVHTYPRRFILMMSCRTETETVSRIVESWTIRLLLQPSVSGVAVSLLVAGLTVDILSTFSGVFVVQCVQLMPSENF